MRSSRAISLIVEDRAPPVVFSDYCCAAHFPVFCQCPSNGLEFKFGSMPFPSGVQTGMAIEASAALRARLGPFMGPVMLDGSPGRFPTGAGRRACSDGLTTRRRLTACITKLNQIAVPETGCRCYWYWSTCRFWPSPQEVMDSYWKVMDSYWI